MKWLTEHDAIQACNEMQAVPRETIRNFQNYFMGIINRYMRAQETKQRGARENDREIRNRLQSNVSYISISHSRPSLLLYPFFL